MSVADDTIPAGPGTCVLALANPASGRLSIGQRGWLDLRPGVYLYSGSARGPGGLRARLCRHLRGTGAQRWHIDYLRAVTEPYAAWWRLGDLNEEHGWAASLETVPGCMTAMPRFGASDCWCPTHLFHTAAAPRPDRIAAVLNAAGTDRAGAIEWLLL
jgi:Uri superfamily endonuclease